MAMKYDSTSHTNVANDLGAVEFTCPACGEETIVRSGLSRSIVTKYVCSKCGFEGPN